MTTLVETVVKLGGSVLADAEQFDRVLAALGAAGKECPLLIVPGGGPFADAVREVDRRLHLSDDAAHWMAVLAMDLYAHLIAARLANGALAHDADEIAAACESGRTPVVAPSRWLRETDPLPHTWAVTSDSIAAWAAGALGARRLVLVKPPGAAGPDVVDAHFSLALPPHITPVIVPADRVDLLRRALKRDPVHTWSADGGLCLP